MYIILGDVGSVWLFEGLMGQKQTRRSDPKINLTLPYSEAAGITFILVYYKVVLITF